MRRRAADLPDTSDGNEINMRLWTLHPKYLDPQGLVALWREALLAREVLRGRTRGYRHHPQLLRFRSCVSPRAAINAYLVAIFAEANSRGYRFDRTKLGRAAEVRRLPATDGQLQYEWSWLLRKLRRRSPLVYRRHLEVAAPAAHPIFRLESGPIAAWEHAALPRHAAVSNKFTRERSR